MADDPAFLFYPGDYLRDTQCLSEKVQVSYDRIICEHMRNICISQQQLNFFTKRLNDDEKTELLQVLTKVSGGFQIKWVADSIQKRREYSESRRKNRTSKAKKTSQSYVEHMDNEDVIVNEDVNNNKKERDFKKPDIDGDEIVFPIDTPAVRELWTTWKRYRWEVHENLYGMMGEQADLKRLQNMDFNQIQSTILTAISNNWKNLYPEKNGRKQGTNNKQQQSAATAEYLKNYYSDKAKQ